MLSQFGDLLATNFWCGLAVQRGVQRRWDLIGKQLKQTHHAGAMLIDRQTEAQTKFSVIFKQRVRPGRTTTVGIGGIRRRR
ncbi:hypothetical protein D3C78_901220 [compost metagenome]